MRRRRRREDGWDEDGQGGQDGQQGAWSGSLPEDWIKRDRTDDSFPPAQQGPAQQGPDGALGAQGGDWPADADWPGVRGYQRAGGQAAPGGRGAAGYGDSGYGDSGYGRQASGGPGYGETGYGTPQGSGAGPGSGGAAYGNQAFGATQGGFGGGYGVSASGQYGGVSGEYKGVSGEYGGATGENGAASGEYRAASGGNGAASGGNGAFGGYGGNGASGGYGAAPGFGTPGGYGASGGYGSTGGSGGYGAPAGFDTPDGYGDNGSQAYGHPGAGFAGTGYGSPDQSRSGYQNAGYPPPAPGFAESPATAQYRQPSAQLPAAEYAVSDWTVVANEGTPGTPRPYGRLSIFTLLDDKAAEFDRLAEQAAEGVRSAEPDTLVYVIHVVPKAPMQRIIYEIYRDRAAFETHEGLPHIKRFVAERKACVLATNIIDLRLKYAKVAALATSQAAAPGAEAQQAQAPANGAAWTPRALEPATRVPSFSPHASGQYSAPATGQYAEPGNGRPADMDGRQAGPGHERPERAERLERPASPERPGGPDARSPRSYPQDWDQPSYLGGRYGES